MTGIVIICFLEFSPQFLEHVFLSHLLILNENISLSVCGIQTWASESFSYLSCCIKAVIELSSFQTRALNVSVGAGPFVHIYITDWCFKVGLSPLVLFWLTQSWCSGNIVTSWQRSQKVNGQTSIQSRWSKPVYLNQRTWNGHNNLRTKSSRLVFSSNLVCCLTAHVSCPFGLLLMILAGSQISVINVITTSLLSIQINRYDDQSTENRPNLYYKGVILGLCRQQCTIQASVLSQGYMLAGHKKDQRVRWGSVSQPSREAGTWDLLWGRPSDA